MAGTRSNEEKSQIYPLFFGRVDGNRGIHRNNAISSLWWWAHVTKTARKEDFTKSLLTFLTTDLRAQIMGSLFQVECHRFDAI